MSSAEDVNNLLYWRENQFVSSPAGGEGDQASTHDSYISTALHFYITLSFPPPLLSIAIVKADTVFAAAASQSWVSAGCF